MTRILFAALILSLFTAGCTLAPKYEAPEPSVSGAWPKGEAYGYTGHGGERPFPHELGWREFFTDQRLRNVIELALANNRDLRLAALNVEMARAIYGIQRATLFPAVDAVGSGSKARVPADLSQTGRRMTAEQYSVDLGILSWEIDFFGRLRSLKDQALEEYLASEQGRRGAQVLLISEVANVYLTLATDRENLRLTRSTLEAQQDSYDMIRRRYETGLASELELRQAQTRVDVARRNAAIYTQRTAQDENALNFLAGTQVPEELLPEDLTSVTPPREISVGISSEVLLNRPDILQAEHLLKAANANIGAARAAFFPRISLTAAIGTASADLSGLFKSGSGTWSYAPQVVLPIFDPRLFPALRASKVERQMLLTQYEKSIQAAFREVADVLAVRGTVEDQLAAQQSLVEATAVTYKLSDSRYRMGVDSYLGVLDAQRSLYAAQQELIVIQLNRLANQIRLYSALGGGGDLVDPADQTDRAP
ncbi:MAG: efflux transporter outer membrane subunit [Desulfuromonadaceae bacterium]|nr:efflux transporter outer membrane subunit [Desulfuromonadaceae bacterium]